MPELAASRWPPLAGDRRRRPDPVGRARIRPSLAPVASRLVAGAQTGRRQPPASSCSREDDGIRSPPRVDPRLGLSLPPSRPKAQQLPEAQRSPRPSRPASAASPSWAEAHEFRNHSECEDSFDYVGSSSSWTRSSSKRDLRYR